MKNKILPLIFGFTLLLTSTVGAAPAPVGESSTVSYEGFADLPDMDEQTDSTLVETAIPEYTITFPAETTCVRYNTKSKFLGHITVHGKYFIRPYKVAVIATKRNLRLNKCSKISKNKRDTIAFDVTGMYLNEFDEVTNGRSMLRHPMYFYRDDTLKLKRHQRSPYMKGQISDINQSEAVGMKFSKKQWKWASPGKYRGRITFHATIEGGNIWY